ncbi:MAG TPA: serine/threonine-protein kinase, partial [Gemmatimonadales bacterium]|nr:serine/threonine-protein kinase [Gemmatimonadales bacterium]
MSDFKDRVQQAVGETYRIERELGGGGMSRVYLAEETRLGRQVVIKVLPPEMAAGVNVERFEREIQLAAKLQHPHIVPVLSAGASDDILFYVMPFIRGESLRAKLSREGELPVGEAVRILRDVVDALAYAHREHVVHRDIKPDNVLLSDNHAVVTDFGVAKAVASSTGESSLTSLGVALGTPAYMAPEQAAADPHVDQRADIYAVGALAYEMLTGRPPFTGATPQSVLSAHVTQTPEPVTMHRGSVPPALAELVMRCLEKKPADRFQRAEELRSLFEGMVTPTGGITPTASQPVAAVDYAAKARRAHPARVGVVFSGVSLVVAGVVYGLMLVLGLPSWVFFGAVGLMVVGLPVMLLTGHQERKRAMARATGVHTMTPAGMKKLFTWKRSLVIGGAAFGALALVAGGAMAMRALGIGPFATLVSSGALKDRQTIILADFVNHAADTTLGPTLTEAFRVDLSQSPTVQLMDPQAIASTLVRMRKAPDTRMTPAVAHEVAERSGVTAMVTGQIDPVGKGYVLSASVQGVGDGRVLTAVRETAADDGQLITALDALSRDLRERIGESLVTIRQTQPLDQVTTSSLDALRKYTEAVRRFDVGDFSGAEGLLHDAVARDSNFAMAYRKLAAVLSNTGASFAQLVQVSTRAFELRDRLPPLERDLTTAWYYQNVEYDPSQAIAAYRSALERDSANSVALNDLSLELAQTRDYAGAESLAVRGVALRGGASLYLNAAAAMAYQGHYDAADSVLDLAASRSVTSVAMGIIRAAVAAARGRYDTATTLARAALAASGGSSYATSGLEALLSAIAAAEGRYSAAMQHAEASFKASGAPAGPLDAAVSAA